MKTIAINNEFDITKLKAGDAVTFSGTVYTARDAAHKRMVEAAERGERLPIDVRGAAIYYAGPTPTRKGEVIGSCGPTTSARMDDYTPTMLDLGLKVMIGKGKRSPAVIESMIKNKAVYLIAVGGAAALIKSRITACEDVAYLDLGCEAIRKLTVKDLPLLVAIDAQGNSIL